MEGLAEVRCRSASEWVLTRESSTFLSQDEYIAFAMIMSLLEVVGDFFAAAGAMWSMTLRDQQTLDDVSRSDHLHVKKPKIEHQ